MKKYFPLILLIFILCLGAFFRFYQIDQYMTFLGDEGRDVLVVKRMLIDHKFTLLGPITSVGSMYMGPIYYYFMAPFLWLWNFNPVGPSVMVALFAVSTIYLIFKFGQDFFGKEVGLIAAFLYAISPLAISSSRSSWNPNIVPFFASLLMYSLLQVVVKKKYFWFWIVGIALGIILQLHYVTTIFIPVILACLALIRFRLPVKIYITGIFSFLLAYSPFLLFELRHSFVNLNSVVKFIFQQQSSAKGIPFIGQLVNIASDVFVRLFWRLLVIDNAEWSKLFIVLTVLGLIVYFKKYATRPEIRTSLKILIIWLVLGIVSFGIYRGVIYDYYLGSLFVLPFIFAGIVLYTLWKFSDYTKVLSVFIFIVLCFFAFKNSPLLLTPNNMLKNTKTIAEYVYNLKDDKPYNFALIAGRNSDHAYRYFLELWGPAPVVIENPVSDPKRTTVTDQLLIVCEEKVCKPLGHPLWEIAGFGRAEIVGSWRVSTAEVFKLVHFQDSNKNE